MTLRAAISALLAHRASLPAGDRPRLWQVRRAPDGYVWVGVDDEVAAIEISEENLAEAESILEQPASEQPGELLDPLDRVPQRGNLVDYLAGCHEPAGETAK